MSAMYRNVCYKMDRLCGGEITINQKIHDRPQSKSSGICQTV